MSDAILRMLITDGWLEADIQGDKIFIHRADVGPALQDMINTWASPT